MFDSCLVSGLITFSISVYLHDSNIANVSSMNMLIGSFVRVMTASVVTMSEAHQSDAREAFLSLPTKLTSDQADIDDTTFHAALHRANVTALFPEFSSVATRCLASIREYNSLVNGNARLQQQCMLGEAWTNAGLLQTFLLSPQGPVDPVEKLAVKLEYFQQEVRNYNCACSDKSHTLCAM